MQVSLTSISGRDNKSFMISILHFSTAIYNGVLLIIIYLKFHKKFFYLNVIKKFLISNFIQNIDIKLDLKN